MRALVDGSWRDGFLDPAQRAGEVRIEVEAWSRAYPVLDVYFVRPNDLRKLIEYVREIGIRATLRKVRSRRTERWRNARWLAVGVGRIIEAEASSGWHRGERCVFIATCAPAAVERLCVTEALAFPAGSETPPVVPGHLLATESMPTDATLRPLCGWSPWSGTAPPEPRHEIETAARSYVAQVDWSRASRLPTVPHTAVATTREGPKSDADRPAVVLVGWGNYAKTTILPAIGRHLRVAAVHEIDPLQIGQVGTGAPWTWSTDPTPMPTGAAAVFAAGYHHTHADVALIALRAGTAAVVEKPLVTTIEQLDELLDVLSLSNAPPFFACFQRRYSKFNDYLHSDIGGLTGQPIDYHCIVFEEPLPRHHWYRWPVSGGSVLSNGCHWSDHFLFLNQWSRPIDKWVRRSGDDVVQVGVSLENGAQFTMILTHRGASRVGMRDYIELRTDDRTVSITDSSRYRAEDGRRVLRSARIPKTAAYSRMYERIAAAVASGGTGDDLRTVELTARLAVELDQALHKDSA